MQVLHLIYVANELLIGPKGVWTGLLTEVLTKLLPLVSFPAGAPLIPPSVLLQCANNQQDGARL